MAAFNICKRSINSPLIAMQVITSRGPPVQYSRYVEWPPPPPFYSRREPRPANGCCPRYFCQANNSSADVALVRNIGLIAHVDAGKTTTTERMLYCSGAISRMGDVNSGDTVTDYMDLERRRGITITSAAVTFPWRNHVLNLIDTPGHIDFTMEVERCLCALDGAVVILDGSAGVQAQTLTVHHQARRYNVPQIVYINKIDKSKFMLENCVTSIKKKLGIPPLLVHYPLYVSEGLVGIIDIVTMHCATWNPHDQSHGKTFYSGKVTDLHNKELCLKTLGLRKELLENIADLDDEIADYVITDENFEQLDSSIVHASLRRITLQNKGVAVFCGSSFKNIGVQLLMDGIVNYLPSPIEKNCKNLQFFGDNLCALLFKVIFDKQKGFLLFLRLYKGTLEQGQKIYNVNKGAIEKIAKLYIPFANEFREVEKVKAGSIVIATGLKISATGDTIVDDCSTAKNAAKQYRNATKDSKDLVPLIGDLRIPDPVFFCSVEPSSLNHQKTLEIALDCLKREDPSLQVRNDEETGQKILSGMGELHLNVIEERIKKEYKSDVYLGPLHVAYKETVQSHFEQKIELSRTIGNVKSRILLTLSVEPTFSENKFALMRSGGNQENLAQLRKSHLLGIENGVKMGLQHGPVLGFPIAQTLVGLHWAEIQPGSSLPVITALTSQCLSAVILQSTVCLLEPYMQLEITTPNRCVHDILGDLSQRRGQIIEISACHDVKVLNVLVPLAELLGYSTTLRKLSSGLASFTMEFKNYKLMSSNEQRNTIKKFNGFL